MRDRNFRIWILGFASVVTVVFLSSCGRIKTGVCGAVPGVPGTVCVNLEYEGQVKHVNLSRDVLSAAPVAVDH